MSNLIDLSGKTLGRLDIVERSKCPIRFASDSYRSGGAWWKCKCSCGTEIIRAAKNLLSGRTKSCGCLNRENGKRAAAQWQERRVITTEKRAAIAQFLQAGIAATNIGIRMRIDPRRVVAISREIGAQA